MAFPVVQSSNGVVVNGGALGTTAINVPYPSGIQAGDLLVLISRMDLADRFVNKAGFEVLWYSGSTGTMGSCVVATKIAVGNESGNAALTANGNTGHQSQIHRVSGADSDVRLLFGPFGAGSSLNPDAPAFDNPFGAEDTLWLNLNFWGGDNSNVASGPSGYTVVRTDRQGTLSVGPGGVSTARLNNNTASENPGQWALTVSQNWRCVTLAVRPAGLAKPDFPILRGFDWNVYGAASNISSFTVPKPDGVQAGDMLMLFAVRQGGNSPGLALPAGFTSLRNKAQGNLRGAVGFKYADGSEGADFTVTFNPTANGVVLHCMRIKGANTPEMPDPGSGNSAAPDPGTAIPGFGAKKALWLSYIAYEHFQTAISAFPPGYNRLWEARQGSHVSFGCGQGLGWKYATIGSDTPGAGSLNQAKDWVAGLSAGEVILPPKDLAMLV